VKRLTSLATIVFAVLLTAAAAGAGNRTESDGGTTTPSVDQGSALVQLKGDPLATAEKTKPAKGKKVDFSSNTVRSYRAELNQLRNDFKQWLKQNAPAAKVTGEFDIALNAVAVELNGVDLGTITSAPMVARAQLQAVYRPLAHEDPDLALVKALQAWTTGGGGDSAKGAGVEVAIVDTGIDATHPCFDGYGDTTPSPLTNGKVIFAGVFNNKAANKGFTATDLNGHGTHVAGTVACDEHTPAVVHGVDIDAAPGGYEPSGVAPRAKLGNFNVFPGDDADARSEDIVDALEEAYERGFDVANMSLGGNSQGMDDLLAHATDNLDRANMVVAVAAGNSGPGFSTIESPGKAARALTAGAYTVGHFVGAGITTEDGGGPYGGATGDFNTVEDDLTLPLAVILGTNAANTAPSSGLNTACTPIGPAGSLDGKIALIARGVCTFSEKILTAQNAGAEAVIVVNNVGGDPIAMGFGGLPVEPIVPAYMVSLADGLELKGKNTQDTTIPEDLSYFNTDNDNIMAGFSSWGPTDVDFRVKPDTIAPGVNVLSSQPAWTCDPEGPAGPPAEGCWAFFQGTSMATPHLAGIAAVVRSQHPTWMAWEVRSAIVNTSVRTGTKNSSASAEQLNSNIIGAGRADADAAVKAAVSLDPVSLSFGAVPSGSGQSMTKTIEVTNLLGAAASADDAEYAVYGANGAKIASGSGVTYTTSYANGVITVSMNAAKGATAGGHQATIVVKNAAGAEIAHAVVYTLIK
jgi:minor extracellular serine protease Vpr